MLKELLSLPWYQHTLISTRLVNTFDQWQSFISNEANSADILLVLSTGGLIGFKAGKPLVATEVIAWTEGNAKPLPVGLSSGYAVGGGTVLITAQPSAYGKLAMQTSLQWLERGLSTLPPPQVRLSTFNLTVRLKGSEQRAIVLPQIYQDLAQATGGLYR